VLDDSSGDCHCSKPHGADAEEETLLGVTHGSTRSQMKKVGRDAPERSNPNNLALETVLDSAVRGRRANQPGFAWWLERGRRPGFQHEKLKHGGDQTEKTEILALKRREQATVSKHFPSFSNCTNKLKRSRNRVER
jgi:hypothetical protein